MHEFFLCVFIHFCRDISDVPGVLFASLTGEIGALLTDEDLAVLRTRLVMFYLVSSCFISLERLILIFFFSF